MGVYSFGRVRADFMSKLLFILLLFTCDMLFLFFYTFWIIEFFLLTSTLLIERLLFNFFSLFDLFSYLLLSPFVGFLGSIDLWGDLLRDRLGLLFLELLSFVGDFCSFLLDLLLMFALPGLLDRLLANF